MNDNHSLFGRKKQIMLTNSMVLLFLFSIFHPVFSDISLANPVPYSDDDGNNFGPLPYENTSVYLQSEIIDVTIAKKAYVEASYTFANDNFTSTTLSILLPFYSRPSNLELYMNQSVLSYSWVVCPFDIEISPENRDTGYQNWAKSLDAIFFTITIPGNESMTIITKYKRNYRSTSFSYLVGTSVYWHHNIESATFIFRIPEDEYGYVEAFGEDYKHYGITENREFETEHKGGYVIVSITYENWTFRNKAISILWTKPSEKSFKESLYNLAVDRPVFAVVSCGSSLIVLLIILSIVLYNRDRKKEKMIQHKDESRK